MSPLMVAAQKGYTRLVQTGVYVRNSKSMFLSIVERGGGEILHTPNHSRYNALIEKGALFQVNPFLPPSQLHRHMYKVFIKHISMAHFSS